MLLNLKGTERTNILANLEQAKREYIYKNNTKWRRSNYNYNNNDEPTKQQVLGASIIHCHRKIDNFKKLCNMFNLGRTE